MFGLEIEPRPQYQRTCTHTIALSFLHNNLIPTGRGVGGKEEETAWKQGWKKEMINVEINY